MPSGFDNDCAFFLKADTRGVSPVVNQMTDGKMLIGRSTPDANGSYITAGNLTAGTGISITNGPGSVTITNTASSGLPTTTSNIATLQYFEATAVAATAKSRAYYYNDFMSQTSTGDIDVKTSGAAAQVESGTLDSSHPGCMKMETGTDATGKVSMSTYSNSQSFIPQGGDIYFETCVNIQNLSTVAEEYIIRIGMHDGWIFTSPPNNGFWFEYDRLTSTNWMIKTASGGTPTSTTSSTSVASGWARFGIKYTSSGTVAQFYLNDVSIGTINTNIPSTGISCQVSIFKSAGTTNRIFYVDYYELYINLTSSR